MILDTVLGYSSGRGLRGARGVSWLVYVSRVARTPVCWCMQVDLQHNICVSVSLCVSYSWSCVLMGFPATFCSKGQILHICLRLPGTSSAGHGQA